MIGKTSTGYDDHQPDGPEHCTDQTELVISNAAGEAGCSQSTVSDLRNPIQQTLTEDGLRTNAGQVSKDPKEREKDKRFVASVLGLFLVILSGWSYLNLRGAYGELRPHHYGFNVEHILLFLLFTGFCVAWLVIKFLPDLIAIWRGTSLSMTWKQNNLVSIFFFPLRMAEALICEPTGGDIRSQVLAGIVKRALADDNWRQKDWLVLMKIHNITAEDIEAERNRASHHADAAEQE